MARVIQAIYIMLLLGMISSWPIPWVFEQRIPITLYHTSIEEDSSPSMFNGMNRMMLNMQERLGRMFGWPSHQMDIDDDDDYNSMDDEETFDSVENVMYNEKKLPSGGDLTNTRRRLDSVEPVCTTTTDAPAVISPRKTRRKKVRTTQTTTCIKELIIDGQKHMSEERTTIDDKGVVIKQSRIYNSMPVDIDQNKI